MKKYLIYPLVGLMLLTSLSTLGSCKKESDSPILISEYVEGSSNNRAIELYNKSDDKISLSSYSLAIYFRGNDKDNPTYNIKLEGEIKAKSTYVIAYNSDDSLLKSYANYFSDDLKFSGSQPVALLKNNKIIDIVGNVGSLNSFASDVSLVRKVDHLKANSTWDEYEWIKYSCDNFKYLGNVENSVTPEELAQGPKIRDEYKSLPFISDYSKGEYKEVGGGGFTTVTLYAGVDGDTAKFYYPQEPTIEAGTKVRFENVDTPESYTGNIQPWGIPAKLYTTERLEQSSIIQLQSLYNASLRENYNRLLCWVWVDGTLLNFDIVRQGFTDTMFSGVENQTYKDITYTNWLRDAALYAEKNKLGIHGQKDPYWDYENNKTLWTGYNPK